MLRFKWLFLFVLLFVACGGGGDSGGSTSDNSYSGFVDADFRGKTMYYVTNTRYQIIVFNTDGTNQASDLVSSGVPVVWPEKVARWEVTGGEMFVTALDYGDPIRYRLISENVAESSFTIDKHSNNGIVSRNMLFYNMDTAYDQALAYIQSQAQLSGNMLETETETDNGQDIFTPDNPQ